MLGMSTSLSQQRLTELIVRKLTSEDEELVNDLWDIKINPTSMRWNLWDLSCCILRKTMTDLAASGGVNIAQRITMKIKKNDAIIMHIFF